MQMLLSKHKVASIGCADVGLAGERGEDPGHDIGNIRCGPTSRSAPAIMARSGLLPQG
jgi:hypothetical protein